MFHLLGVTQREALLSTAAYIRMDLCSCLGYVGHGPSCLDGSLHSDCQQISCLTLQQPQMLPFCPSGLSWLQGSHPCFNSHQRTPPTPMPIRSIHSPSFVPSFLHPDQVLWLCIFLSWKGVRDSSVQLVLCEIFSASENVFPMHLQRKMYWLTCFLRSLLIINMIKMAEKLWYAHMYRVMLRVCRTLTNGIRTERPFFSIHHSLLLSYSFHYLNCLVKLFPNIDKATDIL